MSKIFKLSVVCTTLLVFSFVFFHILNINKSSADSDNMLVRNSNGKREGIIIPHKNNLPRVLIVLGTRPEAIKCAPLISHLKSNYSSELEVIVLSTGQHSEILKQTLGVFHQHVDIDLKLMTPNQSISSFFTLSFQKISLEFERQGPISMVLVQGDTTTSLVAALAASYLKIPVGHVEAGLRSYDFNSPFPEELNRKMIDSFASLLFAPTDFSKAALVREGICPQHVYVTGNTGIDSFYSLKSTTPKIIPELLQNIKSFKSNVLDTTSSTTTSSSAVESHRIVILVTMHRRENIPHFKEMCNAIKRISNTFGKNVMVILPVHPNPNAKSVVNEVLSSLDNVQLVDPIAYDIFPHVISEADIVVTDSGGIQEESASIGKPVILMRDTTERPEGIYIGTIKKIGVNYLDIVKAMTDAIKDSQNSKQVLSKHIFGDGQASMRISRIVRDFITSKLPDSRECSTQFIQDSIAESVYTQNFLPFEIRKKDLLERSKPKEQLTMQELFSLPSTYVPTRNTSDEFGVTAVVGLYKRTGLVKRWMQALLSQTHQPKVIWMVFFASPKADEIEKEIQEAKLLASSNNISLFVNKGEMQLKYFGRFQLAIQSPTRYLAVFDDDCIPERRFFEAAMHTINTNNYRGILGTKGTPSAEDYFFGPVSGSEHIIEVDVVGGSWFMEREWVKLMFREKMFSWATGEDWHLCSNARKYANIRCFVMPVSPTLETNSYSGDYMNISNNGDTTGRVQGTSEGRSLIIQKETQRGNRLMYSYRGNDQRTAFVFLSNQEEGKTILTMLSSLELPFAIQYSLGVADQSIAQINLDELSKITKIKSFNDFMLSREFDTAQANLSSVAETIYHFDMSIQQQQATAVILVGSSPTPSTLAIATACQINKIPLINFLLSENSNKLIESVSLLTVHIPIEGSNGNLLDETQRSLTETLIKIFN
ncbi:predicted protein [Naegleria gruberi]|uniref:UDP-N-acetylglucosamine 2-epimerase (non-hydrolyzing) n=1 Tax=Naegleria gruberi TaxID=5762 RepID=D2VA54_NAEGR|nr:uncharacterized protein NAEGRDRAFT_65743 [Naegleria gruberi]EFC46369.1 predicted protein [Naegleria gruberi]|eukprot:XP_002679113.1 predicted protein [Naegleria gruberi strain NEG-M]